MKKGKAAYHQYSEVITELVAFSRRPGMYVGKGDIDLVIAFLCGIELGSKLHIQFGNDLVEYIFSKYDTIEGIKVLNKNRNYYSLKEQINVLSLESGQAPLLTFKNEALEFLTYISDEVFDGLYRQSIINQLKQHLRKNIQSTDEPFTRTFTSSPEDNVLKYLEEWRGKTLTKNQLELLKEIKEENSRRNNRWMHRIEGEVDDKSKLRELSKILLNDINRDNKL